MERLTQWLAEGVAGIATDLEEKYTAEELVDILVQHLAPYEDTGLGPEETRQIKAEIDFDQMKGLKDLLQAEKAGRLVVLPCKVGDTIYQLRKPGHARGPGVSPRIVSCIEVRGRDYAVCHQGMEPCLKRDLGKTWFLTLQEALEALRKEADQG